MQRKRKISKFKVLTVILAIIIAFLQVKVNRLEKDIVSLKSNETLILLQLETEEKDLNRVHTKVLDLDSMINKYASKYNVEPNLVKAVVKVESGNNPNSVSKAGAIGLGQLTMSTAKAMGVNPYNPEDNIKGTVKYLDYLNKKFNGDTKKVLASYNAGPNAVQKHNGIPPYKETQNYVKKVEQEKAKLDANTKTDGTVGTTDPNITVRVYKTTKQKN